MDSKATERVRSISGTDSSRAEIKDLAQLVHAASEAVNRLGDRLNALALRVALVGGLAQQSDLENAIEGYLNRLSSLVVLAGDQMHRVQTLLRALEVNTTSQTESRAAPQRNG